MSGILILDKPAGLSSNAALQHVRRLYRADKGGHTGALDPLATGVLPVCLGEATKLSGYLLDADKRYRVRVAVGVSTSTGDAEGEAIGRSDASALTRPALEEALTRFTGPLLQTPPMYSALKHQGRPLYELARAGRTVERSARAVEIRSLRLLDVGPGYFELDVECSKGTYVRTLVEDLAASLGQCAHVAALRRTQAGPFAESAAVGFEALESAAARGLEAIDALLLPPLAGLAGWSQVRVDAARAGELAHGRRIRIPEAPPDGPVAVTDDGGNLLGIAEVQPGGIVAPRRWLAPGRGFLVDQGSRR